MNYLNFLKVTVDNRKIVSNISDFENEFGHKFPPILKTFYATYDFSMINKESLLCYFDQKYNTTIQFYESDYIHDNHISLITMFTPTEIMDVMKSIYQDDLAITAGYIAVGECIDQGILLAGINENNIDKIFIEYAHADQRIRLINNNIFEFFQDYEIRPVIKDLPSGMKLDNLYKNWNEDFWRVKEST